MVKIVLVRRLVIVGAVLTGVLATGACAAPTPISGLTCQLAGGAATVIPGIENAPAGQTFHLSRSGGLGFCVDGGGSGITSGNIVSLPVTFPSLGCLSSSGTSGAGSGQIRWSNWSISDISVQAVLTSPLTLTLTLFIDHGPFEGTSGTTTMKATVLSGDCRTPITTEFLAGGPIHFTASQMVT
jgi:hypothetical protein